MNIQTSQIEYFIGCEYGAHEDDMTGPSPLTTVQILERSKTEICLHTPEEAAQICDCCTYGTFPLHHPRSASHVFDRAIAFPGARAILEKWNSEQWDGLRELIERAHR